MRTLTVFLAALAASTMAFAQRGPAAGRGMSHAQGMGMDMGMGAGMGMMGPALRAPITGAPYSGVQTVQMEQSLPTGNKIERKNVTKVFRDGQGRVRMEHTFTGPAGQTRTQIGIFDPVAGVHYMLDPSNKTGVKMPLPAHDAGTTAVAPRPHNSQAQTTDLGTQTVNGVLATGTRITHTIPAGAIGNQQPIEVVRETWISTDLKVPVQIKSTDPRFGDTTMNLASIALGEPDASLFQVPSDYNVTTRTPGRGGMMQHRGPAN